MPEPVFPIGATLCIRPQCISAGRVILVVRFVLFLTQYPAQTGIYAFTLYFQNCERSQFHGVWLVLQN